MARKLAFVACCIVGLGSFALSAEPPKWPEGGAKATYVEMLTDLEKSEREAIQVLEDPDFATRPKATFYAIKFLERIRSQKALPILCERLLYAQEVEQYVSPVGIDLTYPATKALMEIGPSAVEYLLLKISSGESSPEYQLVAFKVMIEILGDDTAILSHLERFQRQALTHRGKTDSPKHKLYEHYDPERFAKFKEMLIVRYHLKPQ